METFGKAFFGSQEYRSLLERVGVDNLYKSPIGLFILEGLTQNNPADDLYFRIRDEERRMETLEKEFTSRDSALKSLKENFTPPFRVGKKLGIAILDSNGKEVVVLRGNCQSEFMTQVLCDYLNEQFPSKEEWVEVFLNIRDDWQRVIKY